MVQDEELVREVQVVGRSSWCCPASSGSWIGIAPSASQIGSGLQSGMWLSWSLFVGIEVVLLAEIS